MSTLGAGERTGVPGWRDAWWLVLPLSLAVVALETGWMWAKMGVPVSCALMVAWSLRGQSLALRPSLGLIVALCLSAVGDWFLSNRGGRTGYFLAGIGFFFGAHVGYLAAALWRGRPVWAFLGFLLVVFVPYYAGWLWPAMASGPLRLAVLAYLLISCVVLASACGMTLPRRLKWPYVAAMGLIVFSDTVISFNEFLGWGRWNALILPTYYLAHPCATWTVLGCSAVAGERGSGGV